MKGMEQREAYEACVSTIDLYDRSKWLSSFASG